MKYLLLPLLWLLFSAQLQSQHINFEEYYLPNGLHVILHQDNTIPIVATSFLREQKISIKENGPKSFHQMEAQITPLQQTILLIIMKIFPQISYN